jgi:hypothetical protein
MMPAASARSRMAATSASRGSIWRRVMAVLAAGSLGSGVLVLGTMASPVSVEAATTAAPSGRVVVWGGGAQLATVPADVASGVTAIAASPLGGDVLALKLDGTVVGWGRDQHGEDSVPQGLHDVVAIAAGDRFELALKSDGSVVAWGDTSSIGAQVPAAAQEGVKSIAAGAGFAIAVKSDGSVVVWGSNSTGALDLPSAISSGTPGISTPTLVSVSAASHVVAALKDGQAVSWGLDSAGQASVPAGLENAKEVAAGQSFSLALLSDGTIVGWGDDSAGQLGVACTASNAGGCSNPSGGFVSIAAGGKHAVGLAKDGKVSAWGANDQGQAKAPSLNHVMAVSAGADFSVALVQQFVPNTPVSPRADGGDGAARISWHQPWDGGLTISNYVATASPGGKTCTSANPLLTSCVIYGLTNGTTYSFVVTATNQLGTSPPSKPIGPVTPKGGPPATLMAIVLAIVGLIALFIGLLPGISRKLRDRPRNEGAQV